MLLKEHEVDELLDGQDEKFRASAAPAGSSKQLKSSNYKAYSAMSVSQHFSAPPRCQNGFPQFRYAESESEIRFLQFRSR
jgi:hypothetical protein